MAIDRAVIGTELATTSMHVERGRLRLFCKAIGEDDPVYSDVAAARAAGYPDLPAPPTFLCALHHEQPDQFAWLAALGVSADRVLHGEQGFTYHAMAFAGDRLTARSRITDVYAKKNGALEFIARETAVTDQDERPIADLQDTVVVRSTEGTR